MPKLTQLIIHMTDLGEWPSAKTGKLVPSWSISVVADEDNSFTRTANKEKDGWHLYPGNPQESRSAAFMAAVEEALVYFKLW